MRASWLVELKVNYRVKELSASIAIALGIKLHVARWTDRFVHLAAPARARASHHHLHIDR